MAKFIYRMQNILNIKLRLETQAKTEFSEAMAKLTEEQDKLKLLLKRKNQYEDKLRKSSVNHLNINDLKYLNESIGTMRELMNNQAVQVRIAERNLDKARENLNVAMQNRKIQEKLKEKAFEEFKLEVNEEEKKEIDQLVSFTYNDKSEED